MHTNIIWHHATVTRERREQMNGHKSAVVWFTGLSCSGKSTLAHAVEEHLYQRGCHTFVLDGDNVRHGLSSNLGFSVTDRKENIRRIAEVAKLMSEAGLITITAFISPFQADRAAARASVCGDCIDKVAAQAEFLEVYCQASLEVCEARDIKGFYKRARAGEIKNYTGIDSPYEEPTEPELVVATGTLSVEECVTMVVDMLKVRGVIAV